MKRILSRKLAVWGMLLLAASAVFAQMPQPFSADFTTTHNGEKMTGKWFFSAPNMRVDMNSMPGGRDQGPMAGPVSMIMDTANQTNYMLLHGPHMYMEFHGERQNSMSPGLRDLLHQKPGADPCGGRTDCTSKKVGTETVNGRSCDKLEVTDKSGKSTIWIDQKLHFPVRVQGQDGGTMDLTNIKEGPQDPSLFKLPAGYKAFDPSAFGGQRRPK